MRSAVLCLLFSLAAAPASAQDWAKNMFDHTSHDFGMVARAAKAEHHFTLQNIYQEDIHIASVQSSCNCTIPELTKDSLKSGEKAEVIARVDTRTFQGRREATIRVAIDRPARAEVQLHIYCYIRTDVVLEPGEINYGSVERGTTASKRIRVNYAGRNDWRILDVQSAQEHLAAKVVEVSRAFGQVAYDLTVDLKADAPEGYLNDRIVLVTNDSNATAARVPIIVQGMVVAPLTVSPPSVSLGSVKPGQSVQKNLVLQGKTPFKLESVTVPDNRFTVKRSELPNAAQIVTVTFTAGQETGKISGQIDVRTSMPGSENLKIRVEGEVTGADDAPGAPAPLPLPAPPEPTLPKNADGWRPTTR
jgi:hypothetical protein